MVGTATGLAVTGIVVVTCAMADAIGVRVVATCTVTAIGADTVVCATPMHIARAVITAVGNTT